MEDEKPAKIKKTGEIEKISYKKIGLLVGYLGYGYHGVQIQQNSELPTIEGELFKALELSEAVKKDNANDPQKMSFQRCSRTDKDVSAVRQLFSLKMRVDVDMIYKINEHLPPSIRAFGIFRTNKKFNSKISCDSRTYEYFTPTFVFAATPEETTTDYRMTDEIKNQLEVLTKMFCGTHNFFNFTSKRSPTDRSLKRFIIDFKLNKVFTFKDYEFVSFLIHGQSFMLHQIRKMIGFMAASVRNLMTKQEQNLIFSTNRVNIPIAPGLGLILEDVHFDSYNQRFKNHPSVPPLDFSKYDDKVQSFKKEKILPFLLSKEIEENVSMNWIQKSLHYESSPKLENSPPNSP